MRQNENNSSMDMKSLIKAVLYLFLIAGIYHSTINYLIVKDWARDDYSYGILIPFIVLYLLWEKKSLFSSISYQPTWSGLILLFPGIVLFWLGELGGEYFLSYFSLWMVLIGLCWVNMGGEKLKTIDFPLAFSLTMFPLPNLINVKVTLGLKLISSHLGVMMMRVYGMSAFREGNVIDLGFTKLQVVDACSGLRYLFPMIVLSILIAYFYRARFWKKAVVVFSSIPLTIFTNALRIALTGILSEKYGSKAVDGFFHDFEGWLIFMITLGVLLLEIWLMNKLFPESQRIRAIREEKAGIHVSRGMPRRGISLAQPQFIASVALLGLTLVLSKGVEFREAVPMNRSFSEFPMKVGKWTGTPQVMETKFIDALDFSDYIMADYADESGREIKFYVAYYESQRKGESIHSPATCLRGGGWVFSQDGDAFVAFKGEGGIPVSRALIQKASYRQLSYYWFPMRGRLLTNAFQMKWYTFWNALTRQRTDGALVRVIALVGEDENLADAEKRLQSFVREILPVLSEFLPGK